MEKKLTFKDETDLKMYCEEYAKEQEKHNGWTNYATWRVNLELFDGYEIEEQFEDTYALSIYLTELANEFVFGCDNADGQKAIADYAEAFLQEVNFYEIAETMVEDNPRLTK